VHNNLKAIHKRGDGELLHWPNFESLARAFNGASKKRLAPKKRQKNYIFRSGKQKKSLWTQKLDLRRLLWQSIPRLHLGIC
jgi:hypothetical protein